MNYKKILNYDNFHKNKLKYIVVILMIIIIGYLIYSYLKQKYEHKHYENFQNNILLGTPDNNLSDVIDENKTLKITYYKKMNNNDKIISYKAIDNDTSKNSKYLGDLIYKLPLTQSINSFDINIIKKENQQNKHLIHILNPSNEIKTLSNNDMKDTNKKGIIYNPPINKTNKFMFKLFGVIKDIDNNEILDLDIKKLNKFLNDKKLNIPMN